MSGRFWTWIGLALAVAAAGCASGKRPDAAATTDRFDALLVEARKVDARDGFEAALPAYLEAIASESGSERGDMLRYQLALRCHETGRDAQALDFIAPLLLRDSEHPLALPLKRLLLGDDARVDVDAAQDSTAPAPDTTPATAPTVGSAMRQKLERLLADDAVVRILLPDDAHAWPVAFPNGAWEGGRAVFRAGWTGSFKAVRHADWRALTGPAGQPLTVRLRSWSGEAQLTRISRGVVLGVPLEDYLVGVVGTEMSPSWHIQALRAQAVASRTYLIYTLIGERDGREYDLRGDVMDPAFRPDSGQHSVATAVRETRGQILLWEKHPARIFFHADNGGVSEDPRYVWGFRLPYYRIQKDGFSDKVDPWSATVSVAEVQRRLQLPAPAKITVGRDPSHRVARLVWTDTGGRSREIKGNDFRLAVGPRRVRSLLFDVQLRGDQLVFSGRGYGHGVGMSQWGAKTMAERGMAYEEILAYYYPGTRLDTFGAERIGLVRE